MKSNSVILISTIVGTVEVILLLVVLLQIFVYSVYIEPIIKEKIRNK